jgi:hypothetical protein
MANLYADRAFISINGAKIADVQSSSLKQNLNAKAVKTMTPDQFNRGFVQGNTDVDIDLTIAVENGLARPKLESLPYSSADIQLTYIVGADQYVATGLFMKETNDDSAGIGDESKTRFSMGALKLTDAVGNSVLFVSSITNG